MEKEFVSYEIALKLKKLGFDEPLLKRFYTKPKCKMFGIDEKGRHYPIKNTSKKLYILGEHFVLNDNNLTIAPLYQQVFRWFREKKLIDLIVSRYQSRDDGDTYYYYQITNDYGIEETRHFKEGFFTYEKAELAGLQKIIEIIENK